MTVMQFRSSRSPAACTHTSKTTVLVTELLASLTAAIEDAVPSGVADPTAPLLDIIRSAVACEDPDGVVVPHLLPSSINNKHLARLGIAGYDEAGAHFQPRLCDPATPRFAQ